jgi:hypothetical protein
MMNQMVSMVGPMAMSHGSGSNTGLGMEEGMGMLTKGHAFSEDFGPGFGRGMAMTTAEQSASHTIGQKAALPAQADMYACPMHPEVKSDKAGKCPKCNMALAKKQLLTDEDKKKVPGYPQDDLMMMIVDDEVAKPETWGLAPGWTAPMMGMMNLVRVLPADKYDKIMALIKSGQKAPAADHSNHQAAIPADAIKITVSKDGYTPTKLTVKAGQPIKLAFTRTDEENCGGTVVFPKLNISAKLPVGHTVLVELPAQEKGELGFACGMNMLKGALIVE